MQRSVAIGIVTYNPNESMHCRLKQMMIHGFDVFLFDNSPAHPVSHKVDDSATTGRFHYTASENNAGLGQGIATVCEQAYDQKFKALVFFDQDTVFDISTLEYIENFFITNPHYALSHSVIVFNSKDAVDPKHSELPSFAPTGYTVNKVLLAINSGSLYFLDNLKKLNWHNTSYFVDGVDYEFCLRSNNAGLHLGECRTTPGFDHETEQEDLDFKLFGRSFRARRYSKARISDTFRSSIKIVCSSIRAGNLVFTLRILVVTFGYFVFQLLSRLSTLTVNKEKAAK
jgi:rhamnosyltransferase